MDTLRAKSGTTVRRTLTAFLATAALLVYPLNVTAASAAEPTVEDVAQAAIAGMTANDAASYAGTEPFVDNGGGQLSSPTTGVTLANGTAQFGDVGFSLPVATPLALSQDGLAVAEDEAAGLGVVVATLDGGTTRLLTVAEKRYSAGGRHIYRYRMQLPLNHELRQAQSGNRGVYIINKSAEPPSDSAPPPVPSPDDIDQAEYQAGLEESKENIGTEQNLYLRNGESVVGGFLNPWAVDATGKQLATSYTVTGGGLTLWQMVDTDATTVFPIVSDPAPIVVIFLLAAGRTLAAPAARAFSTMSIRSGYGYTTRGGFANIDAFRKWAGHPARPNYQWHHIVEQGNPSSVFARAAIHNPRNLVQIPTAIHQKCINKWFSTKNVTRVAGRAFNGTETVRTQIRRLSWDEQHDFGIALLRFCGVDVI